MCIRDRLSTAGKIDKTKILQLCPPWNKPLSEGIPCIVFRRELEQACPDLPGFLSKAGNQSHDVHSKETKIQLMLSLNQLFVAQKRLFEENVKEKASAPSEAAAPSAESAPSAAPAPPSWTKVVQEMETMKPHFAECAKQWAEFAAAWSGGDDSPGLNEAEAYAKTLNLSLIHI